MDITGHWPITERIRSRGIQQSETDTEFRFIDPMTNAEWIEPKNNNP